MPTKSQSPANRRDALRNALLSTVDLLKRRRAAEVDEGYIEDYVALHWLEWHGGSLRLTTTGENMCKHLALLLASGTGALVPKTTDARSLRHRLA
jgi:hypothetical protein